MNLATCHPECTHEGSRVGRSGWILRGAPLTMTLFSLFMVSTVVAAETPGVKVDWLDHTAPTTGAGESFGVPWPRGAIQKASRFIWSMQAASKSHHRPGRWPIGRMDP